MSRFLNHSDSNLKFDSAEVVLKHHLSQSDNGERGKQASRSTLWLSFYLPSNLTVHCKQSVKLSAFFGKRARNLCQMMQEISWFHPAIQGRFHRLLGSK